MRTILRDNYTPEMGAYHEVLIIDEVRHKKYLFDCDGVFTDITNPLVISERGDSEDFAASQKWVTEIDDKVDGLAEDLGDEIQDRTDADDAIWAEIEEIEMSSDVVDIVGTYAELQQYDTTHLKDNDIIKVLSDETHQDETAYYRWSTATDTFSYVGSEGPYYTESEVDALLDDKQDTLIAGANIQIATDGKTISATDTTYSDFTGATSQEAGTHGLVPAPATTDESKFLKGDGSWGTPTDTTYTAGTGLDLNGTEFSVDTTAIQEKLTAGSNVQINDNVISATDTTYTHFTGATASTDGVQGLVPGPLAGDEDKYLKADGTWATVQTGGNYTAGDGIDISAQDVISATNTGKARVLTTDDYNWNSSTGATGTPNCIALWLLPSGMYVGPVDSQISVMLSSSVRKTMGRSFPSFAIVKRAENEQNNNRGMVIYINATNPKDNSWMTYQVADNGGGGYGSTVFTSIVDNLTSTSTSAALSAKQGKVLKDLIDSLVIKAAGAPTTSTVGTVGKLYEDTTNGKLYICTDATNPYVWEEVGGATYTAGSHISIDQNNEISATYSDFVGSDGVNNGVEGLVPAPNFDDVNKYLKGDGTWAEIATPTIEYYTTEELNTLWEAA